MSRCGAALVVTLTAAITVFPSFARADDDVAPQGLSPIDHPVPAQTSAPDFLFGSPRGWLGLRGDWLFPRAGGALFAFVTDQLTLNRSDFRARGMTAEGGIALTPRIDIVGTFDLSKHAQSSEYRHFVASNSQPITQETELDQNGLSAGVRVTPFGKGRSISRYAFIPRRLTPYVGAGAEFVYYDFSQKGQFVDYVDHSIFFDNFQSQGWAIGPYASVGIDLQLWKRLYVTLDGRYHWLHSDLQADYSGFDGIDLAGFKASTGISIGL